MHRPLICWLWTKLSILTSRLKIFCLKSHKPRKIISSNLSIMALHSFSKALSSISWPPLNTCVQNSLIIFYFKIKNPAMNTCLNTSKFMITVLQSTFGGWVVLLLSWSMDYPSGSITQLKSLSRVVIKLKKVFSLSVIDLLPKS